MIHLANASVDLWTPLIQGGIGAVLLGPVLYWMADIIKTHLEKSREASLLMTQGNMVIVLALSHLDNDAIRAMAEKVKKQTEEALLKK